MSVFVSISDPLLEDSCRLMLERINAEFRHPDGKPVIVDVPASVRRLCRGEKSGAYEWVS